MEVYVVKRADHEAGRAPRAVRTPETVGIRIGRHEVGDLGRTDPVVRCSVRASGPSPMSGSPVGAIGRGSRRPWPRLSP
jgi:hypothetical protein